MSRDYFVFRSFNPDAYQETNSLLDLSQVFNRDNNVTDIAVGDIQSPSPPSWNDYDRNIGDISNDVINLESTTTVFPRLIVTSSVDDNDSESSSDEFPVSWVSVVLMAILIVVTIVGNALVCLSVVLVRKLRKPQNYLLVSLATSDLFVAIFVMPFAIVVELYQSHWPLTAGLCDFWVSDKRDDEENNYKNSFTLFVADVLCCTASILNLCGISVDRYQAITAPFDYSSRSTPQRMLTIIFVVWLGSACVSLPPVLLIGNEHIDSYGVPTCRVSQNFWYQIYATMASFYIPLGVMVIVYAKILRVVTDKKKDMKWKKKSYQMAANPARQTRDGSIISSGGERWSGGQVIITCPQDTVVCSKPTGAGTPTTKLTPGNSAGSVLEAQGNERRFSKPRYSLAEEVRQQHHQGEVSAAGRKRESLLRCITEQITRRKKKRIFGGLKEHKASTTLGIIMSAFIICWLPFFVLALVRPIFHWISSLFNWLGYANSALNPVIYATLNRDFRRPFREILSFRCATLDSMMRKEFYLEQYGEDTDNLRNKASVTLIFLKNGNISEPLL